MVSNLEKPDLLFLASSLVKPMKQIAFTGKLSIPIVLSFLFLSLLIFLPQSLRSQTYTTTGLAHHWDDPAAWNCAGSNCNPTPPFEFFNGARIIISDSVYYDGLPYFLDYGEVEIREGGKMQLATGISMTVNNGGNLILNGGDFAGGQVTDENAGPTKEPAATLYNEGRIEVNQGNLVFRGDLLNWRYIGLDGGCLFISEGKFENHRTVEGTGTVKVANNYLGHLINEGSWDVQVAYCASGFQDNRLPGFPQCKLVDEQCGCAIVKCEEPQDIIPGYDPTTRNEDIIGSELTALNENPDANANDDIFVLNPDGDVLIDIIYFGNRYNNLVNILSNYGISPIDFIDNWDDSPVITVFFPVTDLDDLNTHPNDINFVRPTPPAERSNNSSLFNQGDFGQESFFTRAGFDLSGQGVKIGVLSDSYDKSVGNQPASSDIAGGVLPGPGNPNGFSQEIEVLSDLELRSGSDEGRAMLQIIHSVAPKADLAFHTGFVSPGNFAEGILALTNADCDIIVDDITYITEPFFNDTNQGVVEQAVQVATRAGVEYLTSAGNFASRGYESTFRPVTSGEGETVHDFSGSGDYLQQLTLGTGEYLIVLQWDDDFYSIDGGSGARNDLDFFLADEQGNPLYGFNRDNFGGDPIEIMPFTVVNPTTTNLLIKRVQGSSNNMRIKYIVFKAGDRNEGFSAEYFNNASTIIGHANSPAAMTVGAVRFEDTPNFGGNLHTEDFSSTGDPNNPVKPDFTGVNGGNVTVDLGGGDYSGDPDQLPNFFGTSAAAPHVAGVAALLMESRKKFDISFDIRNKLKTTAIDYGEPTHIMGAGFVTSFEAASSFANPDPELIRFNLDNLVDGQNPGDVEFTLIVEGEYFTDSTIIYFRGQQLDPITQTDSTITVVIPPFEGNPAIWVQTPPLTNSGLDGGTDSLFFSDPVLTPVTIKVNEVNKKYGEALPAFSFSTDPALTPDEMALLPPLKYTTEATDLSDVGIYAISAAFDLDEGESLDPALTELFEFSFESNFITVEKTDLLIKPREMSTTYGVAFGVEDIDFDYEFGTGLDIPNRETIQTRIRQDHKSAMATDIGVLKFPKLEGISMANISLVNRAFMASYNSLQNLSLANISLANGMDVIEIDARLFEDPDDWQQGTDFISNISLVNFLSLANTQAQINGGQVNNPTELLNISLANISLANISLANISLANFISLANISLANISLANNQSTQDFSLPLRNFVSLANNDNTGIVTILSEEDKTASGGIPLIPVNLVSSLNAGEQIIVPAAFLSSDLSQNFNVRYDTGPLNINPVFGSVEVDNIQTIYGEPEPDYSATVNVDLQYDDTADSLYSALSLDRTYGPAGSYTISATPTNNPNYLLTFSDGALTVAKRPVVVRVNNARASFGDPEPDYSVTLGGMGLAPGDALSDILAGFELDKTYGPAGSYVISPVLVNNPNYDITVETGRLTVGQQALILTADNAEVTYGDPEPDYSVTISGVGLAEGDDLDDVLDGFLLDRPYGNAGTYSIIPQIKSNTNYDITVVEGTLKVNKAPLEVRIADETKTYGQPNPSFDLVYSGFVAGDGPQDIDRKPTVTVAGNCNLNAGVYSIMPNGNGFDNNYQLLPSSGGTLTVQRAPLNIEVVDTFANFGSPEPRYRVKLSGLVCGDTYEDIFGSGRNATPLEFTLDRPLFTRINAYWLYVHPGIYTVSVNTEADPLNYDIQDVTPGKLVYNPGKGRRIQVYFDCVSYEPNGTDFDYVARFRYVNRNHLPYFVEAGPDNRFLGPGEVDGEPVELFEPGEHYFSIRFDGRDIQWRIKTFHIVDRSLTANRSGRACNSAFSSNPLFAQSTRGDKRFDAHLYPNPVRDIAILELGESDWNPSSDPVERIEVFDLFGKMFQLETTELAPGKRYELDLQMLTPGVYFVKIRRGAEEQVLRIVKQ